MKKSDIALIILIVSVTATASFFSIKAIFGEPQNAAVQVEKVELISDKIVAPQTTVFNKDAINPTVVIKIGDPSNQQPFTNQ
jgi:hypothetical protein